MIKLSNKTLDFLRWLGKGNGVEQCTQAGRPCGSINVIGSNAPSAIKSSLNNLITYGLVTETEEFEFGMRWSRFRVNEKGLCFLSELEARHAQVH